MIIALFVAGYPFVEASFERFAGLIMLLFGLMWSPLIWRNLK